MGATPGYDKVMIITPQGDMEPGKFIGISQETVGSRGIAMTRILIPPGGKAAPHTHHDTESAIYLINGRVRTYYGPDLEDYADAGPGSFVFIPPGVKHQPVNLSTTEEAFAITARNKPMEDTDTH